MEEGGLVRPRWHFGDLTQRVAYSRLTIKDRNQIGLGWHTGLASPVVQQNGHRTADRGSQTCTSGIIWLRGGWAKGGAGINPLCGRLASSRGRSPAVHLGPPVGPDLNLLLAGRRPVTLYALTHSNKDGRTAVLRSACSACALSKDLQDASYEAYSASGSDSGHKPAAGSDVMDPRAGS